jgi:hypothetical protein
MTGNEWEVVASWKAWEPMAAFRWARIAAMFRALGRRHSAEGRAPTGVSTGAFSVRLDDIVGTVDAQGVPRPGVLRLRRKSVVAWHRMYAQEAGTYPPLCVLPGPKGWYLADESLVLVVELLRAKGEQAVRAILACTERAVAGREQAETVECEEGRVGVA